MNSTDPRPNANSGFRNGRMQSTRGRPAANTTVNSRNSSDDAQVLPLNIRSRAAGNAEARIASTVGVSNGSYAYTFTTPAGNARPSRIESTADSNYRYEYYRDYQSNPASPSDGGGDSRNGGGSGGGGGGRGNNNSGNNNGNNNDNGSDGSFQHHVSFSFNIGGSTGGGLPEVNMGGFSLGGGQGSNGGGLFNGLPVNLPVFGSGFPFGRGGRSESRGGFVNFSPLGRF